MSEKSELFTTCSDKVFWHGYMDFYESFLPKHIDDLVVEFGVLKGASIRWLLERYPEANIVGVDILPVQNEWPQGERVRYKQLDQGSEQEVIDFFEEIEAPSLIIEDGSHIPMHQSVCLKHGLNKLKPGGLYILEDIHTSHPQHSLYQTEFILNQRFLGRLKQKLFRREYVQGKQTALSVLLALEQIQRRGKEQLSRQELDLLSKGSHFSEADIELMNTQIKSIHVYKRATFPSACYVCGNTVFDYHNFKCTCGVKLLETADSMSILIVKN